MIKRPKVTRSSLCYSISISLILIAIPLFVIFLVDRTLGPEKSWVSFYSTWQLRYGFSGSISHFVDNTSTLATQGTALKFSPDGDTESTNSDGKSKGETKRYTRLSRVEAILAKARLTIRDAAQNKNMTTTNEDPGYAPQGPIYRNANAFHSFDVDFSRLFLAIEKLENSSHRSYMEMEKSFKIYVYEEGDPPLFHDGPCKSIYTTEGRFIAEIEKGNLFMTKDPNKALVYFLPFSVAMMVKYLYVPGAHEYHSIGRTVSDYIDLVSNKYKFWNRSLGADHFMLSCHDWGPHTTSYVPHLFNNSIRVLCNANISEGFNPAKDVSFPEINLKFGEITGLIGGPSPSRRPLLAFFAGRLHGHIRQLLLEQWKGKDEDVLVYDNVPKGVSYEKMLKKSRFCLCPSGYEVASPRVAEALYAECIPVLISDNYAPPFSDVLNWKAFSVSISVKDIPNIKKILMSISQTQYLRMHRRVKQVQRHFVINESPKRYDVFHMTMHSVWLRRLNVRIEDRSYANVDFED